MGRLNRNDQSKIYDIMVEESKTGHTYIYSNETLEKLKEIIPKKGKILDIGCGTGHIAEMLAKGKWYGVDISKKSVDFARKFYKKTVFGDITKKIPFEDNMFDYVLSFSTLHHVPFKLKETLSEVRRVLKNGGKIIAIEHDDRNLVSRFSHGSFLRVVPCTNERALNIKKLEKILKELGFIEIEFKPIHIKAYQQGVLNNKIIRLIRGVPIKVLEFLSKGEPEFILTAKISK